MDWSLLHARDKLPIAGPRLRVANCTHLGFYEHPLSLFTVSSTTSTTSSAPSSMPTATTTTKVAQRSPSVIPLKPVASPLSSSSFSAASGPSPPSVSSPISSSSSTPTAPPSAALSAATAASLRSLYARAARAFLHRSFALTYSLVASAFALLPPAQFPDPLADQRRKWDILRITLSTTLHVSPPPLPRKGEVDELPEDLRAELMLSGPALVAEMHARSMALFNPDVPKRRLNAGLLPPSVIVTLAFSTIRLDCADAGRGIIEDWLAQRPLVEEHGSGTFSESGECGQGYEKVLEVYSLHILPKLEEWDYAREFLEYERELHSQARERLRTALAAQHSQTLTTRASPIHPPKTRLPSFSSSSQRTASPAPSASSSSTSLSTLSEHTAVPRTPRPHALLSAASSSTSLASDRTATPTPHPSSHNRPSALARALTASSGSNPALRAPLVPPIAEARAQPPSLLALVRASLAPHVSASRITTFIVLFVVLPALSLIFRLRRRRLGTQARGGGGAAAVAKARLGGGGLWAEVVRAVVDGVKMGGRGLV